MSRTQQPPSSPATAIDHDEVIQQRNRYMTVNYGRTDTVMVQGRGAELWDARGKRYLDLFAGFGAPILGHCHPDLVQVVTDQASTLWHVGNLLHTEPQTRLAEAIHRHGFGGRSFFCHSGADANEAAIKLARLHGKERPGSAKGESGRYKIVSATNSFHGRSFATMPATGNPAVSRGFGPHLPGYTQVPFNDLEALRNAIDEETAAVILEPIQGEGGVVPADEEYLGAVRALCDEHDLLMICDEVWCGCGRTGRWFAHQRWGITPDVMTLGKGVGGGLALGVMCVAEPHAYLFDHRHHGRVVHATTLGGNCLTTAVAAKIFEVIERDGLVERAEQLGEFIKARLQELAQVCPAVQEVRGHGLFLGVELDASADGNAWFTDASEVARRALENGLLINATKGNVLRLAPPLTIDQGSLEQGLSLLRRTILGESG